MSYLQIIPKDAILIQEVGMRDGLQSAGKFIDTEDKIRLLNRLSGHGLAKIEVTSFVSPKAVPLLADAEEVLTRIDRNPDVLYTALIPNLRGLERALNTELDEVNVVMSVSEVHNLANLRMSCADSMHQISQIVKQSAGLSVNGTLATAFACPFMGVTDPNQVMEWAKRYIDAGVDSLTVADTIGAATPQQVYSLCSQITHTYPDIELTLHLHNTRGLGIANALAGIAAGVRRFDASFAGIGGCPYAPGATGNVCTEDLVHALQFDGYRCDVDLQGLIETTQMLGEVLPGNLPGLVRTSGSSDRRHPISEGVRELINQSGIDRPTS